MQQQRRRPIRSFPFDNISSSLFIYFFFFTRPRLVCISVDTSGAVPSLDTSFYLFSFWSLDSIYTYVFSDLFATLPCCLFSLSLWFSDRQVTMTNFSSLSFLFFLLRKRVASLFQAPFSSGRNESDQRDKSREELKTRIKISRSFLSGYESYNRQLPSADSIVSRPQAKLYYIAISIDLNL